MGLLCFSTKHWRGSDRRYVDPFRITSIALIVVLSSGCSDDAPPPAEEILRPVRYVQVAAANVAESRNFSGSAEADVAADISFKVGGTVRERPVDVGDKVEADALLAALDGRDFTVAVREAEAQLTRARAEVRNATANYERVRELYENDNVSKSELDSARATAESAEAQARVARQSLTNANLQLSYTRITAPEACEVAEVYVKANENVSSGQPVVRLNCGGCPEVSVAVPETQIAQISAGDQATVRFGALPEQTFSATVDEVGVAMSADSSAFSVSVKITEKCDLIRAGMAADVEFTFASGSEEPRILVPWVAVGEDRDGRYVFVLERGEDDRAVAHRRAIVAGETIERGIVIEQGLESGELVVTAGVRRINDGMNVRLFESSLE